MNFKKLVTYKNQKQSTEWEQLAEAIMVTNWLSVFGVIHYNAFSLANPQQKYLKMYEKSITNITALD